MAIIMILGFMSLLQLPLLLGDETAVASSVEGDPEYSGGSSNTSTAYLPPQEIEIVNPKTGRVRTIRSTGRTVELPADDAKKMANVPLSDLSPSRPEIRKEILDTHNEYRSQANPPASDMLMLEWNDEAAATALAWAKQCKQQHSLASQREIKKPAMACGENLFLAPNMYSWKTVIAAWQSECPDLVYGKGPREPNIVVGHCTQLMWGMSSQCGCAVWECPNLVNKFNYVCHYGPSGNRGNSAKPYTAGPPCASCPKNCEGGKLCTNPCRYDVKFGNCKTYTSADCKKDPSLENDCAAMCKCTDGQLW